jgi:hypothetical protein
MEGGALSVAFVQSKKLFSTCSFDCPMARIMWGIVCFTFGIAKPVDVGHLLGP